MQKKSKVGSIIFAIVVIAALLFIYNIYKSNYFGDFKKAEYIAKVSEFKRDRSIKYGSHDSYRIVSNKFNDAMICKTVEVTPNTPYRVTCMVKTENVVTEKPISDAGAGICIADTTECSDTVAGTSDWKKIEFMFNSKARSQVDIGFRLGSNSDNCSGTAWFSDLKLEVGSRSQDTHWKMVCFIFHDLDINIEKDGKTYNVKETMTASDIQDVKDNMERTKESFKALSNHNMTMDYDIIEITEPIKSVSHDDDNGYFVSPSDVAHIIKPYVAKGEYDYIYTAIKFGKIMGDELDEKNNWIGLGGMDYHDIGYSNIRLPNDEKSYIYKYDPSRNVFPEEAFVHEFLHTAERISADNGYEYPILHDYEKYGYKVEPKTGLRQWYKDYMSKTIQMSHGIKVGINPDIYYIKPVHSSAFTYSMEIKFDNDPSNIIEDIKSIFGVIANSSKNISIGEKNNV